MKLENLFNPRPYAHIDAHPPASHPHGGVVGGG
jgi:hypothetical protein